MSKYLKRRDVNYIKKWWTPWVTDRVTQVNITV